MQVLRSSMRCPPVRSQSLHSEEPYGAYLPDSHATHVVETERVPASHVMHDPPSGLTICPLPQTSHLACPPGETLPDGHGAHAKADALRLKPIGHWRHS